MRAHRTRPFSATNDVANRLLIPLLRSRAGRSLGRQLAVVQYTGRRSGLTHELVTEYVVDGPGVRIDVSRPLHKTWWRNFQTPHPMHLHLAGGARAAVAHVERDGDHVSVLAQLTAPDPAAARRPLREAKAWTGHAEADSADGEGGQRSARTSASADTPDVGRRSGPTALCERRSPRDPGRRHRRST